MGIFDFGKKQRLHTQLYGNTTGKEMFKVNEYNSRKKATIGISIMEVLFLTILYFYFSYIPNKFLIWVGLIMIGTGIYGYFNYIQQIRLRENLY
jgi:hypothetical protein